MTTIEQRYHQKFTKSLEWYRKGQSLFPFSNEGPGKMGSSFPITFDHAQGTQKWDVDDNEIICYGMGSGSLIMGHSPPEVAEAIATQAKRGTIVGGSPMSAPTTHEVRYAEAIKRLMPAAERVQFALSGTEVTYLALRLARAYTGKSKIIKFKDHFHGWHDYVALESNQALGGIPKETLDTVIVAPPDIDAVRRIVSQEPDIAGIIVETHGAHYGSYPLNNPQFLQNLRELTTEYGIVMIMDEVVTGFRLSPGGAQVRWNIEPDLTTMSKIMGGGQPGAAVTGKAEIMDLLAFRGDPDWDNVHRVPHTGTFKALPTTAAAGIATLEAIATKGINAKADSNAQRLKEGLNDAFSKHEVPGHARGLASLVHVNIGADCNCDRELCTMSHDEIHRTAASFQNTLLFRQAMLVNGVDLMGGMGVPTFMVSSVHENAIIDQTVEAFSQALKDLRAEAAL